LWYTPLPKYVNSDAITVEFTWELLKLNYKSVNNPESLIIIKTPDNYVFRLQSLYYGDKMVYYWDGDSQTNFTDDHCNVLYDYNKLLAIIDKNNRNILVNLISDCNVIYNKSSYYFVMRKLTNFDYINIPELIDQIKQ
jgi:hypothetical protein